MLVYEKMILGRIFKVLPNGTVLVRKTGEEIGYLEDELLKMVIKDGYEGVCLDRLIELELKVPLTLKLKVQNFFRNLRTKEGCEPKSIKGINYKNLPSYKELLDELEYDILHRIIISKQNVKTIAKKLGYNLTYIYIVKGKAIKKIYERRNESVSKL